MLNWLIRSRRREKESTSTDEQLSRNAIQTHDEAPPADNSVAQGGTAPKIANQEDNNPTIAVGPDSAENSETLAQPDLATKVMIVERCLKREAEIIRTQAGGRRLFVKTERGLVRVFSKRGDEAYCLEGAPPNRFPFLEM